MSSSRVITLTKQQEAFCQAVIASPSASEAYRRAYPGSDQWKPQSLATAASALVAKPHIHSRIEELRMASARPSLITASWVLDGLVETYVSARQARAYGTCAKVLELAGRSLGLFVDRLRIEQGEVEQARARIRAFAAQSGVVLSAEDEAQAVVDAVDMAIGGARNAHTPTT